MSEAKMREEFEAWAAEHSTMAQYLDRTVSGLYASSVTENFWSCWKASRASVVVDLPPNPEVPKDPEEAIDDSHMDAYHSAVRMRRGCAERIKATGLKVKP